VSRVELLLFDDGAARHPARVINLDPHTHRSYHYWYVFVPGIRPGQCYAYRAIGPFDPDGGLRFDLSKALLDPYGRVVIVPEDYCRHKAGQYGESNFCAIRSVVVDPDEYDWEGDAPLRRAFRHDRDLRDAGHRLHATSNFRRRGTNAGMIEKIPYLQESILSDRTGCCFATAVRRRNTGRSGCPRRPRRRAPTQHRSDVLLFFEWPFSACSRLPLAWDQSGGRSVLPAEHREPERTWL